MMTMMNGSFLSAVFLPMGRASEAALARWTADKYRLQVYNFEAEAMVLDPNGALRLPSLSKRELLMGFDVSGYVSRALPPKMCPNQQVNIGGSMIGNSFCVHVIVMLMDALLKHFSALPPRDCHALISIAGEAPAGWLAHPRFVTAVVALMTRKRWYHTSYGKRSEVALMSVWTLGCLIESKLGPGQASTQACSIGVLCTDTRGATRLTLMFGASSRDQRH